MTDNPLPEPLSEFYLTEVAIAAQDQTTELDLPGIVLDLVAEVRRLQAALTALQARWEQVPLLLDGPGASFLPDDSIAGRHHQPWGQYRQARGAVPWDGEPAEETIRRIRDADRPQEPPLSDDAKGVTR